VTENLIPLSVKNPCAGKNPGIGTTFLDQQEIYLGSNMFLFRNKIAITCKISLKFL
jgi:hypothetical protein